MEIIKAASFNSTRTHRLQLSRHWNIKVPSVLFIGLNPSTADEDTNDRTVSRLEKFAQDWGYGGFYLCNLYSYISTDPKQLLNISYSNLNILKSDEYLERLSNLGVETVFMWGASILPDPKREDWVISLFPKAKCFGKTWTGKPKHPLYLAKVTKLIDFNY